MGRVGPVRVADDRVILGIVYAVLKLWDRCSLGLLGRQTTEHTGPGSSGQNVFAVFFGRVEGRITGPYIRRVEGDVAHAVRVLHRLQIFKLCGELVYLCLLLRGEFRLRVVSRAGSEGLIYSLWGGLAAVPYLLESLL